jgi:hypothetical protein
MTNRLGPKPVRWEYALCFAFYAMGRMRKHDLGWVAMRRRYLRDYVLKYSQANGAGVWPRSQCGRNASRNGHLK